MSDVLNRLCLCKLERPTVSSSMSPIYPTPALVRNSATGEPRPPIHTIKTREEKIFF